MKTIIMVSADGGTKVQCSADRAEHFEHKGYTRFKDDAPKPTIKSKTAKLKSED